MSAIYDAVNKAWPAEIPPLGRREAERAANRLMRKFAGHGVGRVRACWVSSAKTAKRFDRGWQRLVHDISHRANIYLYPNPTGHRHHNGQHAEIELDMIKHVVDSGWLAGKLAPKVKVAPKPTDSDKVARLQARLARWESKLRRCETAIKKLNRSLRYYERKSA